MHLGAEQKLIVECELCVLNPWEGTVQVYYLYKLVVGLAKLSTTHFKFKMSSWEIFSQLPSTSSNTYMPQPKGDNRKIG